MTPDYPASYNHPGASVKAPSVDDLQKGIPWWPLGESMALTGILVALSLLLPLILRGILHG